jgi:Caspase domain/Glucodextranase, domain B/AhpC/TSA family/PEGA domain
LQRNIKEIHGLDAEVIAIASRGKPDVEKTKAALNPSYVIVPGPLPALMQQYGAYNDPKGVAVPATMIIDKTGVLRWSYVGRDDNDRPKPATIVSELRKLTQLAVLELEGPPGAQVRIGQNRYALDAQGHLALSLPPGTYQLEATKEGFVPARQTITLSSEHGVRQRLAMAHVVPPTITVLEPKPPTPVRGPDVHLKAEVKSEYRLISVSVNKEGDAVAQTFAPGSAAKVGDPWIVEALLPLAEGDNYVRLEAIDEHGGKTEQRVTIVRRTLAAKTAPPGATPAAVPTPALDNEAPKIAINYPPEGARVDREQIVVLGLVTDNIAVDRVLVSVNGQMVATSADLAVRGKSHSIRTPVTLQIGDNVVEITAVDKAGNASQAIRTVVRSAPVVAAPSPVSPPPPQSDRWAVVIGIGAYDNPAIPRLKFSVSDADGIYRILTGPAGFKKDNVLLLTDTSERKPTLKNIKWALGTFLARTAKKDDTVVIFFAGHGAPEVDPRGLERDGLAKYLIPNDADPDDLYSTALPMDELQTIFGRLEAERVVVFLDACYSGAAGGRTFAAKKTRASAVDDLFLERLTRSKGRAIVTASRPGEVSVELSDLHHGIFTYYLIEGLKGAADLNRDGVVTLQELYEYLEQQVTRKSRAVGGNQHPVMKGELEGVLPLTKIRGE